mgnify:CR=1 FL=1
MTMKKLVAVVIVMASPLAILSAKPKGQVVKISCSKAFDFVEKAAVKHSWQISASQDRTMLSVLDMKGVGSQMIPGVALFHHTKRGTIVFEGSEQNACTITPVGEPANRLVDELKKEIKQTK